jgi:hypothetical protein
VGTRADLWGDSEERQQSGNLPVIYSCQDCPNGQTVGVHEDVVFRTGVRDQRVRTAVGPALTAGGDEAATSAYEKSNWHVSRDSANSSRRRFASSFLAVEHCIKKERLSGTTIV